MASSQFNRATEAAAPARLLVQALCLSHRADERQIQADDDRHRLARPASAIVACTITAAATPARCRCRWRWPNRSTPSPSNCRSRSATAIRKRAAPRSSTPPQARHHHAAEDTPSLPVGAERRHPARACGRLCRLRQWRQANDPLCRDRDPQQPRRIDLPSTTATRRRRSRSCRSRRSPMLDTMMKRVVEEGTGGRAQLGPGVNVDRQDRHHQWLQGRLVLRLHRQYRRLRLVWQRRQRGHGQHDRRHAAGQDLARHHGLCASGHSDQADPRAREPGDSRRARTRRRPRRWSSARRRGRRRCRAARSTRSATSNRRSKAST